MIWIDQTEHLSSKIKRSQIKLKYLQDKKENSGIALPNLKHYYQAAALTWMRNWFLLFDLDMLSLGGHDLPHCWHSYLWTDGKIPKTFALHFLRNSLFKTWITLRPLLYKNIPLWISTGSYFICFFSSGSFLYLLCTFKP